MCGILIHLFCHSQMEACKNKGVFEKQVVLFLVKTARLRELAI